MSSQLQFTLVAFLLACGAFAYFLLKRTNKPKVLPPPRSKSTERSYQETNSVASLFVEAMELKKSGATWPVVLKSLNAKDEPHVRTLLLELRGFDVASPREALNAIEIVCIESKKNSECLSRVDLLERAKSTVKKI